ncbi:hypothetical protein Bbelb_190320 [Branchiostoma belcheri]|nr:hypothetical protein Bbelb_190320 [Branchiostoma belcheri]
MPPRGTICCRGSFCHGEKVLLESETFSPWQKLPRQQIVTRGRILLASLTEKITPTPNKTVKEASKNMGKLGWTLALLLAVLVGYIWYEPAFDPESLRGARVVVTGCSSGIGEQMAYHYARFGARVIITARREGRLKKVVAKMKDLGAQEAIYVAGDIISGPPCICPGCS